MRRSPFFVALVVLLISAVPARAQEDVPVFVEKPLRPKYQKISGDELEAAVSVRSSRSYAVFGYNTPTIVLQLPGIDNSIFAKVDFEDPVLYDESGSIVSYERMDGLYQHDTYITDVRMTTADIDPARFARATGRIVVRYPAVIRTHEIPVRDGKRMSDLGFSIEGRNVEVTLGDAVPEDPTFGPLYPLRAWDGSGRMIAREDVSGGYRDNVEYRRYEYRADIAKLEADRVEEWIGLAIEYDLPASPMRGDEMAGTIPDPDPLIATTSAGTVTVSRIELIPESVLGPAAGLSRSEIAEYLEGRGYREINDEALLRAATESNVDAIQLLLAAGVSPDARINDATALMSAASFGAQEVIILLIDAGADVDAGDMHDATAIIRLANRCSTQDVNDAARALIAAGADVNAKAKGGGTALMMADVLQCAELAKMLRAAGAKEWQ